MKNKLQHCQHCPDQGWYPDNDPHTGEPVQVQCEFCWTNPLSYFNSKKNTDPDAQKFIRQSNPQLFK